MKKVIGIVIIVVILLFIVLGVMRSRKREEVQSISKIQQEQGIPVLTARVEPGTVNQRRSFYGTVRSANHTNVSSKLMERIDKILVNAGDRVKKDQVLVVFDTTASQTGVVQHRLAMENSRRDYDRMQALFDEGAISRQTLDQVRLGYEVALENYKSARRHVELVAPVSGTIARVDFTDGDIADPGDVIITIAGSGQLEITFDVAAEDRATLHEGQPVEVKVDGEQGIWGKITQISLATAPEVRLFPVIATIPAAEGLYSGLMATVEVTIDQKTGVLAVTNNAVLDREGETALIVVSGDIANIRPVQVGLRGEEQVEIIDGVREGEIVAVYGHKALKDGVKVKVVEE